MTTSFRILHIFGQMNRGGAEMRTIEIMERINREEFQFDFCCLSGKEGSLDEKIYSLGGKVHSLKLKADFPFRFIRLLKEHNYDAVHSHVAYFSGFILLLANLAGISKRIAHFRYTFDVKPLTIIRRLQLGLLKKFINFFATDILAVSESSMRQLWKKDWKEDLRCQIIYNGIDTDRYSGFFDRSAIRKEFNFDDEATIFIHVGNVRPVKNHSRILKIFSEIRKISPEAKLCLVGFAEENEKNKLCEEIAKLNLSDSAFFLGVREDIPNLLHAADLMIFPSISEGLPGVVLEAIASGLTVLASKLPSTLEIAKHLKEVHLLDLEMTDGKWAKKAIELVVSTDDTKRHATKEEFKDSPFVVSKCLVNMEKVWEIKG